MYYKLATVIYNLRSKQIFQGSQRRTQDSLRTLSHRTRCSASINMNGVKRELPATGERNIKVKRQFLNEDNENKKLRGNESNEFDETLKTPGNICESGSIAPLKIMESFTVEECDIKIKRELLEEARMENELQEPNETINEAKFLRRSPRKIFENCSLAKRIDVNQDCGHKGNPELMEETCEENELYESNESSKAPEAMLLKNHNSDNASFPSRKIIRENRESPSTSDCDLQLKCTLEESKVKECKERHISESGYRASSKMGVEPESSLLEDSSITLKHDLLENAESNEELRQQENSKNCYAMTLQNQSHFSECDCRVPSKTITVKCELRSSGDCDIQIKREHLEEAIAVKRHSSLEEFCGIQVKREPLEEPKVYAKVQEDCAKAVVKDQRRISESKYLHDEAKNTSHDVIFLNEKYAAEYEDETDNQSIDDVMKENETYSPVLVENPFATSRSSKRLRNGIVKKVISTHNFKILRKYGKHSSYNIQYFRSKNNFLGAFYLNLEKDFPLKSNLAQVNRLKSKTKILVARPQTFEFSLKAL